MQLEQLSSSIITPRSNLRIQLLNLNNDGRVLISLGSLIIPQLWSQVGERVFTIFIGPKSGNGELCRPQVVG